MQPIQFIILFSLIILIVVLADLSRPTKYVNVKIGNTTVRAEVADTIVKQAKGLMFRKSLENNDGMLFIFDKEDYYIFWMMNVSFPIDMIWISSNKTVVDITKNAEPCSMSCRFYSPKEKSQYVLEVNTGFADKHKIKVGSKVKFNL